MAPGFAYAAAYNAGTYGNGAYGATTTTSGGGHSSGGGGSIIRPVATTTTATSTTASSAACVRTLSDIQVQAILGLLNSFGAEQAVIDRVTLAFSCQATTASTPAASTPSTGGSIARTLQVGAQGEDVRILQQFLNTHGFVIAPSGDGSPGKETTYFGPLTEKAVANFQFKYGIIYSASDPGYGIVGPKTRAKIQAVGGI